MPLFLEQANPWQHGDAKPVPISDIPAGSNGCRRETGDMELLLILFLISASLLALAPQTRIAVAMPGMHKLTIAKIFLLSIMISAFVPTRVR